jgi:TolB-like protein/DNA-binding winged helix-turn-helix (wHTH) protein/Tfp pilus assembly protein PilF
LYPVRFGVFEVDFDAGELRRRGVKVRLHEQPFKVLCMLLDRPGDVFTREELYKALWPDDTYTDSDLGLNSAIMKLRAALGDAAENPRFIETLPRRGYRLLVPVVEIGAPNEVEKPNSAGIVHTIRDGDAVPILGRAGSSLLWKVALGAVTVSAVSFGAWHYFRPPAPVYRIAVLPLINLSPAAGGDYFSDGLTDEIISNLSVIDGLEIKSQTSSFSFKNKTRDIHAVGDQLGVNLVLEGSVLHEDDKLRVNVQLVRVADDHPIWSGRFERQPKEIFAVQDEISRSIVNELRLKLGRGQRRYNTDLETYDLFLKGLALSNQNPGADSNQIAASIPVFEAAVARDTNFAPAYAGIANAYAYLSSTPRTFSPELAFIKMQDACERAHLLDPFLAEAFACMGLVHSREFAWQQAEDDFHQAFRLNPNLARPHEDFAMSVLFPEGRLTEAEQELRVSMKLDPLNPKVVNPLNIVLISEQHYDEVIANCRKNLALNSNDPYVRQLLGRAMIQKGDFANAAPIFEQLGRGSEQFLGYVYAKQGRRADAQQIIAAHPEFPWVQAIVSGGLGDKDQAIAGLERMAEIKDPRFGFYAHFPELSIVRGDARLNQARAKQGLPAIR